MLEPGQYVILPRTNGIGLKRPHAAMPEGVTLVNGEGLSEIFEGALEDIFYRFDTMITNSIDYEEFKELLETIGQPSMTEADFEN